MSTNRVSTAIPNDVIARAIAALNQVKALLKPYLQSLTVEERRDLPKMSNKSFSFVSKVNDYCSSNPEFCPPYLNAGELDIDFSTVAELKSVHALCEQICGNVDDTIMLAGSEAYTAALLYYSSVQTAARTGQANAKPIFEDLHERFVRKAKATAAAVIS